MPDYTKTTFDGFHLYFTAACVVEAFHAHADKNRSKGSAAKFFIRSDGSVTIANQGRLSQKTLNKIVEYIALNHSYMYNKWRCYGGKEYYNH